MGDLVSQLTSFAEEAAKFAELCENVAKAIEQGHTVSVELSAIECIGIIDHEDQDAVVIYDTNPMNLLKGINDVLVSNGPERNDRMERESQT